MKKPEWINTLPEHARWVTSPARTDRDSESRTEKRQRLISGFGILALVIGVYLVINLCLRERLPSNVSAYVIQPLLWTGVALSAVLASRWMSWGKLRLNKSFVGLCLILGAFQIAVLLIVGLFMVDGLGRSPYSHRIEYLFLNTIFFFSSVVGVEFSRAYLLRTFSRYGYTLVVVLTALLYTLLMIPLTKFNHSEITLPFLAGTILPLLAQNLLASLLAFLGGPIASIAFWGVIKAFEWYSPILPDPSWIVKAFVIVLTSVAGLLIVQSFYSNVLEPDKSEPAVKPDAKSKKRSSLTGWVLAALACVVIVFITFGALGVRPMLVGSGSMRPALEVGDLAMVREISPAAVGVGDIIAFQDGNGDTTLHRVTETHQDGSSVTFTTKGDANDSPDRNRVQAQYVRGKVWFRIPKLGWISIWMKNLIS